MGKLIWLLVAVFAVSTVYCDPVVDVAQPIIGLNVDPIQNEQRLLGKMNENPSEASVAQEETKLEDKDILPPIAPMFPSFFQPFGDAAVSGNAEGSDEPMNQRRGGILTILVIKSKKPDDETGSDDPRKIFEENFSKINQFKSQVGASFSKLAGLIRNDLFGPSNQQQSLIGGGSEDVERKNLLGGSNDIDSAVFKQQQEKEQDETSSKFQSILSWFKSQQPMIGAESSDHDLPQIIIRTNSDSQLSENELTGDDTEYDEQQIQQQQQQQLQMLNEQKKKCMMYSFMRLKASIYYRTIVHLLFITGIMLIIFFMAILSVRIYKRRQALKYYSKNMKISTIDLNNGQSKSNESSGAMFLFRSSSLKNSYAQKYALNEAVPPPPAYTQLLAASSQTSNDDEKDEKKSLPDYETAASK